MIRLVQKKRTFDPSRAVDSTLVIPCPAGFAYDPYQKAAIEYAQYRRDTLIADEPGLGKTIEAIGVSNLDPAIRRVLVICPSFLKPHWKRSFLDWTTRPLNIDYIKDGKGADFPDVTIINYELLEKYYDQLRSVNWDYRIVDEVHKLKNRRSDRTMQVWGGIKRNANKEIVARYSAIPAKKTVYLTGTPSLNGKPKELWPLLQQVDPDGLGSDWFGFATRYCQLIELKRYDIAKGKQVHSGWKWDGADNLEELQERMRSVFMIRRLKSQVMKDLKPKLRIIVPIENTGRAQKLVDAEWKAFNDFKKDKGDDALLEMPEFSGFSSKMLELGLTMVKPAIEIAEADSEEHDKIFIVCYHNEVARQIADYFGKKCVLINGDVQSSKRQVLVDKFQDDPTIHYAVGTWACAEGFTMTKARLTILAERRWEPGMVTQIEDRTHRRGQTEQAMYKHLVREGSLAEHQVKILIDKQEKNARMFG